MDRENIKTTIKRRSFREGLILKLRRGISGTINVVLLILGMKLIVHVQDNEDALK